MTSFDEKLACNRLVFAQGSVGSDWYPLVCSKSPGNHVVSPACGAGNLLRQDDETQQKPIITTDGEIDVQYVQDCYYGGP